MVWYHAICFLELFPSTLVEKLSGWDNIPSPDQGALRAVIKGKALTSTGNDARFFGANIFSLLALIPTFHLLLIPGKKNNGEPLKESKARGNAKRKNADDREQHPKIVKTDPDMGIRKCTSQEKGADNTNLESKLEAQSKALWALKDDLKKYVSTAELRQMLEANDQGTSGSELDLRDRWYVSCHAFLTW